jgi:hypothetical protein
MGSIRESPRAPGTLFDAGTWSKEDAAKFEQNTAVREPDQNNCLESHSLTRLAATLN